MPCRGELAMAGPRMLFALYFTVIASSAPVAAATSTKIALPGAPAFVGMDYLAYDALHQRIWVPAGNTASVDVLDTTGHVTQIHGFATVEREFHGKKHKLGPSSVTIGEGTTFIGNRADASVCAIDGTTLARGACVTLASAPDGIAYVKRTHEVWVTTPREKSLTIIDVSHADKLAIVATIPLPGEPEGYAVDEAAGVFITNLEDADRTLLLDVATRKVTRELHPACSEAGPRGVVTTEVAGIVVVACGDHLAALDTKHDKVLSTLSTGDGLDNIAYDDHLLYAAAGKDARLTVALLGATGALSEVWRATTAAGARVVVCDAKGSAYVADSQQGVVWKFERPRVHD